MSTNERPGDAAVLFGGADAPTTVTSPPRTPESTQEKSTEDVLFGGPPRHPVKAGEQSTRDVLFPVENALRPAFRQQEAKWHDVMGLTSDERRRTQAAMTEDIERLGIDPHVDGAHLVDALAEADVQDYRGVEEDHAQYDADAAETRRTLREQYGQERGDRILQATRDFIAEKTPRLHERIAQRGLGSRPDIALPLCEHVRKLKHL